MKTAEEFITVRRILIESLEKCRAELKKISLMEDSSIVFHFILHSVDDEVGGIIEIPNCEDKSIKDVLLEIVEQFKEDFDNFDEDNFVKENMNGENAPSIRDLLRDADELQCFLYRITRELLRAIL